MKTSINTVLFDLDGTLLDTAPDLGFALNTMLIEQGHDPLSLQLIRPEAGRGFRGLLKLGFNMEPDHPDYTKFSEKFFHLYEQHIDRHTQLFSGMLEVLHHLETKNIAWGIVTNKPAYLTHRLLECLALPKTPACVVCGDTLEKRKPHPEPLLHACEILQKTPQKCLYIGDSEVDIIASKAAQMKSLAALYGYIPAHIDPKDWQADGYIQEPVEIVEWIKGY